MNERALARTQSWSSTDILCEMKVLKVTNLNLANFTDQFEGLIGLMCALPCEVSSPISLEKEQLDIKPEGIKISNNKV